MAGWGSWLGLSDDEEGRGDPVSRTLDLLGQGVQAASQAVSDVAAPIGQAVQSAITPPETVTPRQEYQPQTIPTDVAPGPTGWEVAQGIGTGIAEGARAGAAAADPYLTGPARTVPTWEDPLAPVREVAQHVAANPLSTVPLFQYGDVQGAATDPIGRRTVEALGGGTEPVFRATVPESVPLVGGMEIAPSAQDIGGLAAQAVLDPTNLVGVPAATKAAPAAVRAVGSVADDAADLARRGARAAGDFLDANAARVAAADARMAAEGSTLAPSGLGVVPEGAGNLEGRIAAARARFERAADALAEVDEAMGAAESGPPGAFAAARRAYAPVRAAYDDAAAELARLGDESRAVSGRIEGAGYGVPVEDAGLSTTATALARETRGAAVPPFVDDAPRSVSLNAASGAAPETPTSDLLGAASRTAGQSLFGGASGAYTGAALPAETDEERARNARIGAAAGLVGGPVLSRGVGALQRGAGARGALAAIGAAPSSGGGLASLPARFAGLEGAVSNAAQRAADIRAEGLSAPSPWEWIKSAGYAGIYGPATFVNNAIGGAQELVLAQPKELARSLVEGRGLGGYGRQAAAQVRAVPEALEGLGRVLFPEGAAGSAAASGGSQGTAGLSERVVNPVGHAVARLLERPGELLTEAPDAMFRPAFVAQGMQREADRVASSAGLKGPQAAAYAERLMADAEAVKAGQLPTMPETQRVIDAGTAYADQLGYKGAPGKFGQYLADLSKRDDAVGVLASFLLPFPSMAARMTTAAGRSTPGVGLLPTFRRGQSTFDVAYDQVFGSLVAAGLAGWASQGGITGSGPDDAEKRRELQALGWQPNSTYVGGYYVPNRAFGRYQPLFDAAGELHDALAYAKPGEKKALVVDLAKRAGSLATDQAGLSGLADLYDMFVNDKGATFPGWAARSAVRYLPGGGILRAAAASADPLARRPEPWAKDEAFPTTAIAQNLETAIPGLRGNVPAAQDVLGRPAENPQRGLGAVIPRTTRAVDDPLVRAYLDAGVDIGGPPGTIALAGEGTVELSPAQQRRWNAARGQALQQARGEVLAARSLPQAERQAELRRILATARTQANDAVEPTLTPAQRARARPAS